MDGAAEVAMLEVGAVADSMEGLAVALNVRTGVIEGCVAAGTLPAHAESKIAKATNKANRFAFIGL